MKNQWKSSFAQLFGDASSEFNSHVKPFTFSIIQ